MPEGTCADCGRTAPLRRHTTCRSCYARNNIYELIGTDPDTSPPTDTVVTALARHPVFVETALATESAVVSALTALLPAMWPLTHDDLDALGDESKSIAHLRAVLVQESVLPDRDEIARDLDNRCATLLAALAPTSDVTIVRSYTTHLIARLRSTHRRVRHTRERRVIAASNIRAILTRVAAFIDEVNAAGHTLQTVPLQFVLAYANHTPSGDRLGSFLRFAGPFVDRRDLQRCLRRYGSNSAALQDTETHLALLQRMVSDTALDPRLRLAGLLLILLGQPLTRILALSVDDFRDDGRTISLTLSDISLPLTGALAEVAREVLARAREHWKVHSPHTTAWLFPSPRPGGHPIGSITIGRLAADCSLDVLATRSRARYELGLSLPACVLVDTLHMSRSTAVRWVNEASTERRQYHAAKVREYRDHKRV